MSRTEILPSAHSTGPIKTKSLQTRLVLVVVVVGTLSFFSPFNYSAQQKLTSINWTMHSSRLLHVDYYPVFVFFTTVRFWNIYHWNTEKGMFVCSWDPMDIQQQYQKSKYSIFLLESHLFLFNNYLTINLINIIK